MTKTSMRPRFPGHSHIAWKKTATLTAALKLCAIHFFRQQRQQGPSPYTLLGFQGGGEILIAHSFNCASFMGHK